jgi:hypothetical protein
VILFFRLLAWTAKYEPSHPKLFALAGVFSAGLLLALWIAGVYADDDGSCSKH